MESKKRKLCAVNFLLFTVLISRVYTVPDETFIIGYLTNLMGTNSLRQGLVISGAISYAVEKINNSSLLNGHKLKLIYNDTKGDTLIGTNATIHQYNAGAIAFFGPEDSCEVEATVAASLNLPMISYKCANSKVSQKDFYKTFARTYPPDKGVVRSILVLLKNFHWSKFSIISERSPPYETVARGLEEQALSQKNFTINHKGIKYFDNYHLCCEQSKPCCEDLFLKIVEDTHKNTRVYVFFGKPADLIKMLQKLQIKKILDNGEYVIIYVDLEAYSADSSYRYFWRMDLRDPEVLKLAARSLLVIVPSPPHDSQYVDFLTKVREYNVKEPFNLQHQLPYPKHVTEHAAYLYDSVMLYAEALSFILKEDGNPKDGEYIIQKIISKKRYRSVTGAWIQIDENGDVEGNYTVLALQVAPPNLTLKGITPKHKLTHIMQPVATFQYDNSSKEPIFTYLDVPIHWVSGFVPHDEPPCGFDGSGCIPPPDIIREVLSGALALCLVVVSLAAWICYKNWKYEQEIAGLLWKIAWEDVLRYGPSGLIPSDSKTSVASQISMESKVMGPVFTHTALYKGTVVAMKTLRFNRRTVEIQRETKKEMKIIREMHHDNINQFIGACVQPNHILLLTEYCSKGSLQDILENDDIKLDHMFIASLVFDLIKGMIFLHESDLKVHGNLKSTNCVVSSRWVLQVTDFGLNDLHAAAENDTSLQSYEYYRNLLWTAPELLRNPTSYPKGTQKADIYAFSLILHEIMFRQGPFGSTGYESIELSEIIQRVKTGPNENRTDIFRPPLTSFEGQDYILHTMVDCWLERPEDRPDFRHIRERLHKMKQGMKSNIMDNMMSIMEKYANNLEEIVDERTAQLVEEQKKTEALLHRMLPKPVAEQLMRGKAVIPESFDAVTIYFSDIVGFTEMSASSTPMEVVTFLNDLYTVFDSIIGNYDVYKVETIGDAYMVVSGLPIRNGERHAREIASMALDLLEAVQSFRIHHKQNQTLKLRIGIHTGPVVAGIVGLTMPRYCLFGDTVNTASRMESNGEALKIHISEQCRKLLERAGGYEVKARGYIKIKGKGDMQTHWLQGKVHPEAPKVHQTIVPQPLFLVREFEKRKRSPKLDNTRRGSLAIRQDSTLIKSICDQTPPVSNGTVSGIPVFLRVSQESPKSQRRLNNGEARRNRDAFKEKVALSELNETSPYHSDNSPPAIEESTLLELEDENSEKDSENIELGLSPNRRHRSGGGDYRTLSERNKVTPLAHEENLRCQYSSEKHKHKPSSFCQPSKRWRSCDEIDAPRGSKGSLKDWFAGLFNNAKLLENEMKRTNNAAQANLLRPAQEGDEESIV